MNYVSLAICIMFAGAGFCQAWHTEKIPFYTRTTHDKWSLVMGWLFFGIFTSLGIYILR
jgi:hypothetical protein